MFTLRSLRLSRLPLSSLSRNKFPVLSQPILKKIGKMTFCTESHSDFSPKASLSPSSSYEEVEPKLRELVQKNRVVLFMKGSPNAPQCGFSRTVTRILHECGVVDYTFVNVLASAPVREGIKKFSDWPTIPQLYVDGEFLGGCDIVTQMFQEGELQQMVKEKGLQEKQDQK